MKKEMLINASQAEECRIAIVENGRLEELYVERASQDNYVGNIYKGKIVNLEPSIQAVFVDFGVGRNGFLHISDVEPRYFRQGGYDPDEMMREEARQNRIAERQGRRPPNRAHSRPRIKPPIQEIFQRGDEVLVQVIKEGIGNKGPTLSTYISIPGRYLVLMPSLGRVGVSRKIEDEQERRRLKDILYEINPPKGLGFIVRTAGAGRNRKELSRDLAYLLRLWKVIVKRVKEEAAPVDIYEESDMIIRTIRDIVTSDIDKIVVDRQSAFDRAREFLRLVMPRQANKLELYKGRDPLFHKFKLEDEIANIHSREVALPDGGSIVIDQTEALVAIDVNSGNFRIDDSAEETAYRLNLAAAKEIARQLRLRDLGGVIVNDFIDMRRERHRRGLERALRDSTKRDRARTKILRTSPFGLVEMTRQRIRPGLKRSFYQDCPCCSGRGSVKTDESMALEVVRMLHLATQHSKCCTVTVKVNDLVSHFLNNQKRREVAELEEKGSMEIHIHGSENVFPEHLEVDCRDEMGNQVRLPRLGAPGPARATGTTPAARAGGRNRKSHSNA
ncbi:MAG: Rne/Rng family ribonuclease [Planctomycetota bacterium]|nr:Rne/Rng family ribonuclease [Planctomycetota bacterium]